MSEKFLPVGTEIYHLQYDFRHKKGYEYVLNYCVVRDNGNVRILNTLTNTLLGSYNEYKRCNISFISLYFNTSTMPYYIKVDNQMINLDDYFNVRTYKIGDKFIGINTSWCGQQAFLCGILSGNNGYKVNLVNMNGQLYTDCPISVSSLSIITREELSQFRHFWILFKPVDE